MYNTTGTRGNIFSLLLNDQHIRYLQARLPFNYSKVVDLCKNIINTFESVPKVKIDNAFVYLDYQVTGHIYTCIISQAAFTVSIAKDKEIVLADVSFSEAAAYLIQSLTQAEDAAIIEIDDTDVTEDTAQQRTSSFVKPAPVYTTAPEPESKFHESAGVDVTKIADTKKKIKISITYTREVSIGDNTFSSVMNQVGRLCEAQPHTLNNGFVLTDTNIAIADN